MLSQGFTIPLDPEEKRRLAREEKERAAREAQERYDAMVAEVTEKIGQQLAQQELTLVDRLCCCMPRRQRPMTQARAGVAPWLSNSCCDINAAFSTGLLSQPVHVHASCRLRPFPHAYLAARDCFSGIAQHTRAYASLISLAVYTACFIGMQEDIEMMAAQQVQSRRDNDDMVYHKDKPKTAGPARPPDDDLTSYRKEKARRPPQDYDDDDY